MGWCQSGSKNLIQKRQKYIYKEIFKCFEVEHLLRKLKILQKLIKKIAGV